MKVVISALKTENQRELYGNWENGVGGKCSLVVAK
jgi:hypothetical protein